jgi:hypothetical protein
MDVFELATTVSGDRGAAKPGRRAGARVMPGVGSGVVGGGVGRAVREGCVWRRRCTRPGCAALALRTRQPHAAEGPSTGRRPHCMHAV